MDDAKKELQRLKERRDRDAKRKAQARAKAKQTRSVHQQAMRVAPDDEIKNAAAKAARQKRRAKPVKHVQKLELASGVQHTGRWLPTTPIAYISTETNERVREEPTIMTDEFGEVENWLDDLPEEVGLDFFARGKVEPELRPASAA